MVGKHKGIFRGSMRRSGKPCCRDYGIEGKKL